MFRQIGPTEILIILAIVVLLFGGKKLPELARGAGRGLRIFKSEVKGDLTDEPEALEAGPRTSSPLGSEPLTSGTDVQQKKSEQG
jgi:sec-independent protein translocase protein TatA